MKTRFFLPAGCILLMVIFSSCFYHHNNDVSVSIHESDEEYRMSAKFDDIKTSEVQNYIKECTSSEAIFKHNNHGTIDAEVILDDNTRFYIKSYEGRLKILLDKEENSAESYERVKEMCEGVKELLADN